MSAIFDGETDFDEDGVRPGDDAALSAVSGAFGDLHLDRTLEQICARSGAVRRRRRAVPVAGVALLAAVGLSAAALLPSGGASSSTAAAPKPTAQSGLNIDLAAFSLSGNADGSISLQIKQLGDKAELEQALDRAGVHSLVIEKQYPDSYATHPPTHLCYTAGQMTAAEQAQLKSVFSFVNQTGKPFAGNLVPGAMPAGATLVFVIVHFGAGSSDPAGQLWFVGPSLFDGAVPYPNCNA
jgi:hypothetical protein